MILAVLLALQSVEECIEQLGSDSIETREGAQERLVELGAEAIPALETAARGDSETAARALDTLRRIRLLETFSRPFVREHGKLDQDLRSRDPKRWLELIEGITSIRVTKTSVSAGQRKWVEATLRDLLALMTHFYDSGWDCSEVELAIVYHLANRQLDIREDLSARIWDFQTHNKFPPRDYPRRPVIWFGNDETIRSLQDSEEWQEAASDALFGIGTPERMLAGTRKLIEHPKSSVRRAVVDWMAKHIPREAATDLARVLTGDSDEEVRKWTSQVIGHYRVVALEPELRKAALREEPASQVAFVEVLTTLADPGSSAAFEEWLSHESAAVRRLAVDGLRRARACAWVDSIVPLLQDPDFGVRRAAALAVGCLGGPTHRAAVRPLLRNAETFREALEALGRLGDADVAEFARRRFEDFEYPVRRIAAVALTRLGMRAGQESWGYFGDEYAELVWEMNRFTEPERLAALERTPVSIRTYSGAWKELAAALSKDTGMVIECNVGSSVRLQLLPAEGSLADALRSAEPPMGIMVEKDRIRIRYVGVAADEWKKWGKRRK